MRKTTRRAGQEKPPPRKNAQVKTQEKKNRRHPQTVRTPPPPWKPEPQCYSGHAPWPSASETAPAARATHPHALGETKERRHMGRTFVSVVAPVNRPCCHAAWRDAAHWADPGQPELLTRGLVFLLRRGLCWLILLDPQAIVAALITSLIML